jgi:hypothetical protein
VNFWALSLHKFDVFYTNIKEKWEFSQQKLYVEMVKNQAIRQVLKRTTNSTRRNCGTKFHDNRQERWIDFNVGIIVIIIGRGNW